MCVCSGGHEAVDKQIVWDSQGEFSHYTARGSLKKKSSKKRKKKKKTTKHR